MQWTAILLAFATFAFAGEMENFDEAKFESLTYQEKTVLVQFYGVGCGMCKEQEKALKIISSEDTPLAPFVFVADLTSEAQLARTYKVRAPGVILIFKGKRLIGEAAGLLTVGELKNFVRESRRNARGLPAPRRRRPYRPKR
jgi:hypothetical protein